MDKESSLEYELCSYPALLFDYSGMLQKPNKPEPPKAIKWLLEIDAIGVKFSLICTNVLDRDSFLHRILWAKKEKYSEILDWY